MYLAAGVSILCKIVKKLFWSSTSDQCEKDLGNGYFINLTVIAFIQQCIGLCLEEIVNSKAVVGRFVFKQIV